LRLAQIHGKQPRISLIARMKGEIRPLPIRDIREIRGSSSFGSGYAGLGSICGFRPKVTLACE
jgi:hypothetical protein